MRFLADDALEGREPGNARIRGCGGVRARAVRGGRPRRLVSAGAMRAAKLDDNASTLAIDGKPLVHRRIA